MYFGSFLPENENWRWYGDASDETPTSALAGENSAPTGVGNESVIKLRVTLKEAGGLPSANEKFKLQFSRSSDFSTGATDVAGLGMCTTSSGWCYALGGGTDNAPITTKVLSDSDTNGTHNTSATTSSTFTFQGGSTAEFEFTIKNAGADYSTAYFFRVYDVTNGAPVPLAFGATIPSLTTNATTITFSVAGLPSGTATEGVTTNISTSGSSIDFGVLPVDTTVTAAQRLTAGTSALHGYTTYVFETQDFLASPGTSIPHVLATNSSPGAFEIAGTGAYGYHTSDHELGTDPAARFAENNTYARYDETPREISFSSTAISSDVTDMITKVQITSLQPAGSYSTSLIYVIVPIF